MDERGERPADAATAPTDDALRASRLARREVVEAHRKNKVTAEAYDLWARHWYAWCHATPGDVVCGMTMPVDKQVYSGAAVPSTVELWLAAFVTVRPKLKNGKPAPGTGGAGRGVGIESVRQAIKAVTDLQAAQRLDDEFRAELDGVPAPRAGGQVRLAFWPISRRLDSVSSSQLKAILEEHAHQTAMRREELCGDRASGRNINGDYDDKQKYQLSTIGLFEDSARPHKLAEKQAMLMRVSQLLRDSLSFRGDDARKLQLADVFLACAMAREGPQPCRVVVFALNNGKSNLDGKVMLSASMRHAAKPELCLQFHLALSFFELYVVFKVDVPRWRPERDEEGCLHRDFYSFHVLPGCNCRNGIFNVRASLTPQTMSNHCSWMYANIRNPLVNAPKKVHLNRGRSLRDGIASGVSEQQVGRAGNYRGFTALNRSYLTDLPWDMIRHTAGFPTRSGYFFLLRALVQPPEPLVKKVFATLLDSYYEWLESPDFNKDDLDLATKQFVEVVEHLAVVLWQDLAVLYGKMKHFHVFSHAPFNDDAYGFLTFRQELLQAMTDQGANQLQRTAEAAQERGDEKCAAFAREVLGSVATMLEQHKVTGSASGPPAQPIQMRLSGTPARHISEIHDQICGNDAPRSLTGAISDPPATTPALFPETPPRASAADSNDASDDALLFGQQRLVVSDKSTWPVDPPALPNFALATKLASCPATIGELAEEYFRGVGGGAPLKYLDEYYGPIRRPGTGKTGFSWRSARARDPRGKSRKFNTAYEKRKPIFDYIEKHGEQQGVKLLEDRVNARLQPGQESNWKAICDLLPEIIKELRPESFEKNSKRAQVARAKTRDAKRQRVDSRHAC
ncbi:hypothetical protein CTAYLR_003960 [Chrysophaeum taylorii]|uniref:Ndc10 domain-containing protein n=1 Tax=Chrysophaeum taylorii TaxID=2483200 RepID=A0AAD7XIV8_9STRA|nr:hypothetical protein CTAYLR_003960 [Chrysophaeum taylorii]